MRDNSAQWFEYDWPLDGAMARFGADMALIDADRAARPLLMYVSCQSRSEKRETLSAIERSIASVTTHNSCQNGHIHQNTPGKPELSKVLPR